MLNPTVPLYLKNWLNVWTKCSAWSLDWGWATSVCLMQLAFINLQNSSEVNSVLLSWMRCCGMPYWANISRSFAIVASLVILSIISTSNHLEWLSTTIRNILPINGHAKLIMSVLANPTGVRVSVGASQVTIATNTNNLYPTEQMKKIKLYVITHCWPRCHNTCCHNTLLNTVTENNKITNTGMSIK